MMNNIAPLLATMMIIGMLPLLAVVATAFTKITVVLLVVRNALGIQQAPPNIVVFTIAIVLTLTVMQPVFQTSVSRIQTERLAEMTVSELTTVAGRAAEPFRRFMLDNSEAASRKVFADAIVKRSPTSTPAETDYSVVVPAFMLDELTKSFVSGFLLYILFIAIDFVVGAILIALGMQMMSATAVATPLKLLLFVQVQGWERLFDMLVSSYR